MEHNILTAFAKANPSKIPDILPRATEANGKIAKPSNPA